MLSAGRRRFTVCVGFPLSRIQSTCFASVLDCAAAAAAALTLTPFSRIFRCSQSNCAPAMADHPFFSLADARLCHLGHTPPLGMRHQLPPHQLTVLCVPGQQARSCHNLNRVHWKKEALDRTYLFALSETYLPNYT